MRLNKPVKILVGLGTVWVALYPFLIMAIWFFMVFGIGMSAARASSASPEGPPPYFLLFFVALFFLQCISVILQMGLSTIYLIHVIKNDTANEALGSSWV